MPPVPTSNRRIRWSLVHPLSRQIQRFALFVTLARYDSVLRAQPYFARAWEWSADRRELTFVLHPDLPWHDGTRTTARDVAFTLDAARNPVTGYYRAADLATVTSVVAPNDTTVCPLCESAAELHRFLRAPIFRDLLPQPTARQSASVCSRPFVNGIRLLRREADTVGSSNASCFPPHWRGTHAAEIVVAVSTNPQPVRRPSEETFTMASRRPWPTSPPKIPR